MARTSKTPATARPSEGTDWAEDFFARGWRANEPWIVLERVSCSAESFERIIRGGGSGFGMFTYRVLYARQIGVSASREQEVKIVQAIRRFPSERAAMFEEHERPMYESHGYPPSVLAMMAPQHDKPLIATRFATRVLLVEARPDADGYMFLGAASTFDMQLEALVHRPDVAVDEALATFIFFTCNGKPDEKGPGSERNDRRYYLKSRWSAPFHPKRLNPLLKKLRARTAGDSSLRLEDELLKLLHEQVPGVIGDLRSKPPRAGRTIHSVGRHRLVERVTDSVWGESRRAERREPKELWWDLVFCTEDESMRVRYLNSLSPGERHALVDARAGVRPRTNPSTPRVLLYRAKAKLRTVLRDWQERSL